MNSMTACFFFFRLTYVYSLWSLDLGFCLFFLCAFIYHLCVDSVIMGLYEFPMFVLMIIFTTFISPTMKFPL